MAIIIKSRGKYMWIVTYARGVLLSKSTETCFPLFIVLTELSPTGQETRYSSLPYPAINRV